MRASPQGIALINLAQQLPETSMHYMDREEAARQLRDWTGQDFGMDVAKWEAWCLREGLLYSTWEPMCPENRGVRRGDPSE
jgi:hypothetical protein